MARSTDLTSISGSVFEQVLARSGRDPHWSAG
jgi:hypothetical protein